MLAVNEGDDVSPSGTHEILSINGVDKVYGTGVVALRDMVLKINQGDFISLLGPSGCGKSTALRLIAGLIQPTKGAIQWTGGNKDKGSDQGEDLGVVFQEPALMPWATVEDNIWLPMRLKGITKQSAKQDIDEILSLVGLSGFQKSYPRELSGGMKMRVSIARAIVTRPRLLLMDEPFAALDEITRFKLNNDLLTLKERFGCTIIFVTHSVFESVFLANRLVVMGARPGRVIEELPIETPFSERSEEYRTSAEFAAYCRSASDALKSAMGS